MKFHLEFLNGILYYFLKFLVSLHLKLFVVALFRFCMTLISLCPICSPDENHSIFKNALYGERIILHQSFFHKIYNSDSFLFTSVIFDDEVHLLHHYKITRKKNLTLEKKDNSCDVILKYGIYFNQFHIMFWLRYYFWAVLQYGLVTYC